MLEISVADIAILLFASSSDMDAAIDHIISSASVRQHTRPISRMDFTRAHWRFLAEVDSTFVMIYCLDAPRRRLRYGWVQKIGYSTDKIKPGGQVGLGRLSTTRSYVVFGELVPPVIAARTAVSVAGGTV